MKILAVSTEAPDEARAAPAIVPDWDPDADVRIAAMLAPVA